MFGFFSATKKNNSPVNPVIKEIIDLLAEQGGTGKHLLISLLSRELLYTGQDIHAKDKEGQTALHHAVFVVVHSLDLRVIDILISKGADPHTKDKEGKSPLDMALGTSPFPKQRSNTIVAALLKSNRRLNCPISSEINPAISQGLAELSCFSNHDHLFNFLHDQLLYRGSNINAYDEYGNTALHYAVYEVGMHAADSKAVSYLLQKGADPYAKNVYEVSPYGMALEFYTPTNSTEKNKLLPLLANKIGEAIKRSSYPAAQLRQFKLVKNEDLIKVQANSTLSSQILSGVEG